MRPQYTIVEGTPAAPLDLEAITDHLRVDSTDDLAYINSLVAVAREYVDSVTGKSSLAVTWKVIAESWQDLFDDAPKRGVSFIDPRLGLSDIVGSDYVIPLHRSPLVSVASIKYYAPDDAAQTTLATSAYRVVTAAEPGLVQLVASPPSVDDRVDAIEIQFTAGSTPTNVQRHAINLMVAHLYENRVPVNVGNIVNEVPFSLRALITNQKTGGWF